jgi:hypothetical protein
VPICTFAALHTQGGALGGSQAQGEHFKEAVHINQSLTTLGRVINALVEAQKLGRMGHGHIPYRDSRLTFLLQVRTASQGQQLPPLH